MILKYPAWCSGCQAELKAGADAVGDRVAGKWRIRCQFCAKGPAEQTPAEAAARHPSTISAVEVLQVALETRAMIRWIYDRLQADV